MVHNILQILLDQEKFDAARQYIESLFIVSNGDEEKEASALSIITGYLGVLNDIDQQYIGVLDDAARALKKINASEKEQHSTLRLMEVRAKLNA